MSENSLSITILLIHGKNEDKYIRGNRRENNIIDIPLKYLLNFLTLL